MTMRAARHDAGFTLVELLVALAIFMVIMGSLALLLSGAVNTANQGYAMMNAMERARGSMSVLEADLKTAFASPENQQFFQFYGEPNGFCYSGQLLGGGFGRVTYAVHVDNRGLMGTVGYEIVTLSLPWSEVATQFARVLLPGDAANGVKPNIDKNGDGVGDITISGVNAAIDPADYVSGAFSFKAYAERIFGQIIPLPPDAMVNGIPDFDYPVDFQLRIQRGVLLRYEERGQGTMTEFTDPVMVNLFASDGTSSLVSPFGSAAAGNSTLADFSSDNRDKLNQLQQGHYWVRMLSGNLPLNNTVDPFMPPAVFWAEDGNSGGKSWRDYLVTEGILVSAELVLPGTDRVVSGFDSAVNQPVAVNALDMVSFFSFGIEDGTDCKWFNTLWNMPNVSLPSNAAVTRPMFDYFLFGPNPVPVGAYFLAAPAGAAQSLDDALRVQVYDYAPGDPLKPRLPAWVAPGFWVFGDPPRSGAPPFHHWFQQKVDIPLAYLRSSAGA